MERLNKLQKYFLYFLPVVLYFSYYPLISFGSNETMNFELSVPLIWLVLFFFISIPRLIDFFKKFDKKSIPLFLFPLYLSISILWSPNKLRAILTAGILWLIVFAIISIYQIFKDKNVVKNTTLKAKIISIFFLTTSAICIFCWLQCLLDIIGVGREATLLCPGCTYHIFGFPHPNGFAVEPQFMGNLLIAPSILALYLLASTTKNRKLYTTFSIIFIFTLFLTLSRGAIYSFSIGAAFLIIYYLTKKQKSILLSVPIIIISALFSLVAQGIFAEISPTNDTFYSGIAKSIHQLSLGKIDIREEAITNPKKNEETGSKEAPAEQAIFDGYIEASTSMRFSISERALNTWSKNAKTAIFGVGLGGAGMSVSKFYEDFSPKEIIHNEYLSLLLEAGIIGCVLIIILIALFVKAIVKKHLFWLFAILLAYAFSILFFAGLPNALHILLLPPLLYLLFPKDESVIN